MTLSSSVTDWMKRSIPRFSSVDPGSPSRSAFCEEDVGEISPPRHLGHLVAAHKWNASRSAATVNRLKLSVRHPFMCRRPATPRTTALAPVPPYKIVLERTSGLCDSDGSAAV